MPVFRWQKTGTGEVSMSLETMDYHVTVLVTRSTSRRGAWVAHGLEVGVVAQGDSLGDALVRIQAAVQEFIEDALNAENDPLEIPCRDEIRAEAQRIKDSGMSMICPPRAYHLLDERRVESLVQMLRLQFYRRHAVMPDGLVQGYTTEQHAQG